VLALGAQVGDKKTIVACAKRLRVELSSQDFRADESADLPSRAFACEEVASDGGPSQRSLFGT